MSQLKSDIEQGVQERNELQTELREKDNMIAELQAQLESKIEQNVQTSKNLELLGQKIAQKDTELAQKNTELAQKNTELAQKDA